MSSTAVGYEPDAEAMDGYRRDGERRAMELGNRGPIRFGPDGSLHSEIVEAYWRTGFYVFEGVLGSDELADLDRDIQNNVIGRFPVNSTATLDSRGRPAIGVDQEGTNLYWSKPLADPMGGTDLANGRHPVKMPEPTPAADAPEEVVYMILGSLQYSETALRVYGHPELLAIAAQINGEDFTPFNEALFIKDPGRGASVAWHRDGITHWRSDDFDEGIHGFNFMAQVYGCNAANALWVVTGTHKQRDADIAAMVAAAGSQLLPGAVPMICAPGDVAMNNRQVVHGSFANTSDEWRVTVNFGFHRRSSVLGVNGGGLHNAPAIYDEERIRCRARVLGYAIDARRQRFPNETPFAYKPHADEGLSYVWDDAARADLVDYNQLDLSI